MGSEPEKRRVLTPEDMTMRIEFRTRCPRCATVWMIASDLCVPDKMSFEHYVNTMRTKLEDEPRVCCAKKLPVIGEEWSRLWP